MLFYDLPLNEDENERIIHWKDVNGTSTMFERAFNEFNKSQIIQLFTPAI